MTQVGMDIYNPDEELKIQLKTHIKNIMLNVYKRLPETRQVNYNYDKRMFMNNYTLLEQIADSGLSVTDEDFYDRFNALYPGRTILTEDNFIQYVIYNISYWRSFQIREAFVNRLYNFFGIETENLNSAISQIMNSIMERTKENLINSPYRLHPAFSMKGGKLLIKHLNDLRAEYQMLKESNDDDLSLRELELKNKIQYLEPIINEWILDSSDSDFDSGIALLEISNPQQIVNTTVFESTLERFYPEEQNNIILKMIFDPNPEFKLNGINVAQYIEQLSESKEPTVMICTKILEDIQLIDDTFYEINYTDDSSHNYAYHVNQTLTSIYTTLTTKEYIDPLTNNPYNPYQVHLSCAKTETGESVVIPNRIPEQSALKNQHYQFITQAIQQKLGRQGPRVWVIYHAYQRFCLFYYLFTILSRYIIDTREPDRLLRVLHREIYRPMLRLYAYCAQSTNQAMSMPEYFANFEARYRFIFDGENREAELEQMGAEYSSLTEIEYRKTLFFNGNVNGIMYDMGKKIELDFIEISNWKREGHKAIDNLFTTRLLYYDINTGAADRMSDIDRFDLNECVHVSSHEYFYRIHSFMLRTVFDALFDFLPNLTKSLSEPFKLINNNESTRFTLHLVLNKLISVHNKEGREYLSRRIEKFQETQKSFCDSFIFVPSNTLTYQIRELETSFKRSCSHTFRKEDFDYLISKIRMLPSLSELGGFVINFQQRVTPDLYSLIRLMFKYDVLYKTTRFVCSTPLTNEYMVRDRNTQGLDMDAIEERFRPSVSIPYSPFDSEIIDITLHNGENHTDYHLYHQSKKDNPNLPNYLSLAGVFFDYMNMFGSLRDDVDKVQKRCDRLYRSLAVFLTYSKNVMLESQYLSSSNSVVFNRELLEQCNGQSGYYSSAINQILTSNITSDVLVDTIFTTFVKEPPTRQLLPLFTNREGEFYVKVKNRPYQWYNLSAFQKINYKKVIEKLNSQTIKAKLTEIVLNSNQPNSSSVYGELINNQLYPFLNLIETDAFTLYIKGGAMWRQYIRERLNPSLPDTTELINETKTISDCDVLIVPSVKLIKAVLNPMGQSNVMIPPYSEQQPDIEKQINIAMYKELIRSVLVNIHTLIPKLKRTRPEISVFEPLVSYIRKSYSMIEPCSVKVRYHDVPRARYGISYTYIRNNQIIKDFPADDPFTAYFNTEGERIQAVLSQVLQGTNLKLKFFIIEETDGDRIKHKFYLFRIVGTVEIVITSLEYREQSVSGIYDYEILDVSSDEFERKHNHSHWNSSLGIKMLDIDWFIRDNFTIFSENNFTKPEKRCKRYQQLMKIICQLNLYDTSILGKRKDKDILYEFAENKKQFLLNLQKCVGTKCSELFSDLIILLNGYDEDKININNRWKIYCNCIQGDNSLPTMYRYKQQHLQWLVSYIEGLQLSPQILNRSRSLIQLSLIPDTEYSLIDMSFMKSLFDTIQTYEEPNKTQTLGQFRSMILNYLNFQEFFNFNDPRGFTSYYKINQIVRMNTREFNYYYLHDMTTNKTESLKETLVSVTRRIQNKLPHHHPAPLFDATFAIYCSIPNTYSSKPLALSSKHLQDTNLQKIWEHSIVRNNVVYPKSMYDIFLDKMYTHSITSTDKLHQLISLFRNISIPLPIDYEWQWVKKDSMYGSSVPLIGEFSHQNKLIPSDGENELFYSYLNYSLEDIAEPIVSPTYYHNVKPYSSISYTPLPRDYNLITLINAPLPRFFIRGIWNVYGYFRNQLSHELVKCLISSVYVLHHDYLQSVTDLFTRQIGNLIGLLKLPGQDFRIGASKIIRFDPQQPISSYLNRVIQLDYYLSLDPNQVVDTHHQRIVQNDLSIHLPSLNRYAEAWQLRSNGSFAPISDKAFSRLFQVIWFINQHISHKSWLSMTLIDVLCCIMMSKDREAVNEFYDTIEFSIKQKQATLFMFIHSLLPKGAPYRIDVLYQLLDNVFILDDSSYQHISSTLQQEEVYISQLFYHPTVISLLHKFMTQAETEYMQFKSYRENKINVATYVNSRAYGEILWVDDNILEFLSKRDNTLFHVIQSKINQKRQEKAGDIMELVRPEEVPEKRNNRMSILRNDAMVIVDDPPAPHFIQVGTYSTTFADFPIFAVDSAEHVAAFLATAQPDTVCYTIDSNNPAAIKFSYKEGRYLSPYIKSVIEQKPYPHPSIIPQFMPLVDRMNI